MVDPLSTGASAVTILDRLAAFVRWALRRPPRAVPPHRGFARFVHGGLEVRPVHYRIDLSQTVPKVEVELLAINYLRRPISLREVKITRLTAGAIPTAIDNIPLAHEVTVEPQSSILVYCERALADSEARVAGASAPHAVGGSLSITARGIVRGKEVTFGPATALKIDGHLAR